MVEQPPQVLTLTDIRRFEGPEPSNWELFRAIEAHRLDTRSQLRDLDARIANTVVGREYYLAQHAALEGRVDTLYAERRDTVNFRRTMTIAVASILATSVASLLVNLVHIHG